MKREDPLTRPRDLRVNLRVPPHVIHIHHNANPPRIELASNPIHLPQRHHHRPVRSEHRMQRLDTKPHSTLSSMRSNLPNSIHHHPPSPIDIAIRSRPIHQHQQIGAHRRRLIDGPQIILNPTPSLLCRSRRKHPTPAQTRHPQPSLPNHPASLRRSIHNRIPPRPNPGNPSAHTRIHNLLQSPLPHRHLVQTKTRQILHPTNPASSRTSRIRRTASSGSLSRRARSAYTNNSARCTTDRALSAPFNIRKCL